MKTTFLKTIGLPIISEQAEGQVASMKEVLINPESGGILAIGLIGSPKVISICDVRKWDLSGIKITDETAIIDRSELFKLSQFHPAETKVFAKEVVQENGTSLGLVHDFVFDTDIGQLTQLYVVKKTFIFFTVEKRIINYREIVEIKQDEVIVKDRLAGEKEGIREFLEFRESPALKETPLIRQGFFIFCFCAI